MHRDHMQNEKTVFFVVDDKPAIIEVFGNRRERIELIKLYVDGEGDIVEPGNILDEETLKDMEELQGSWKDVDPEEYSYVKKEVEKHTKKNIKE